MPVPGRVLDRVDRILNAYGGRTAYRRDEQASHRYLSSDLGVLREIAAVLPLMILVVAAFLVNVILARLVRTQRTEIAPLKAFGYTDVALGAHFALEPPRAHLDSRGPVEPYRNVQARLVHGHRSRRTAIQGLPARPRLRRPITVSLDPVELPPTGLVVSSHLAETLGVGPGDSLTVEILEGARPVRSVPVVRLARQYIGESAFMRLGALQDLLHRGPALSGAYLALDDAHRSRVLQALGRSPRVRGIEMREQAVASLERTMTEMINSFSGVLTLFACAIAFGVVYNTARVTLSERARELASLRVLGFTRGEVGYILLGELAVLTLVALPLGLAAGWGLCGALVRLIETDLFRLPMALERSTFATAAAVVLGIAVVSGGLVWRRLRSFDYKTALEARE